MWQRIGSTVVALIPAGWSRSQRFLEHVGLLRIDGEELHRIFDKPSLSTILCLHDTQRFGDYDALVPVAFFANELSERAAKCPNAVQVGPRILEEKAQPGITQSELRTAI